MARAVHHEIGAEAADDLADRRDARLWRRELLNIHGGFGAELATQREARLLRRADHDHAARAHLLRGRDREHADRPRALDHHRVADPEAADALRAGQRADAGGQRLRERAEPQRHVVGQPVDLGPGQLAQVDIDHLGEPAPQMRRPLEAEIAPVVDRRQALVRGLGIVGAPVAGAARHQRRQHHLGADGERLAGPVVGQLRADLDDHPGELVAERERPGQGLGPVALQDVQIGAAHAAGADLDQRGLGRHARPRHRADHRRRPRPVKGRDANAVMEPQCSGSNGFRTSAPVEAKSRALRVTTVNPCTSAVAASRPSTAGRLRRALSHPHCSAIRRSMPMIRSANRSDHQDQLAFERDRAFCLAEPELLDAEPESRRSPGH